MRELWCLRHAGALARGAAGLFARVRACAGAAPPNIHIPIIHAYLYYGGLCGVPACGQAVRCVVSVTCGSSGVAPRAWLRDYVSVLVPRRIFACVHTYNNYLYWP